MLSVKHCNVAFRQFQLWPRLLPFKAQPMITRKCACLCNDNFTLCDWNVFFVYVCTTRKKMYKNINIEVVIWIENFLNCKIETSIFCKATSKQNVLWKQWWAVTKYFYFATVLKYIFQVSILYLSSFILGKFYSTTLHKKHVVPHYSELKKSPPYS